MTRVPKRWPNATIVCLASGPSLTPEDVSACQGKAPVMAVNDTVRLAPWADVLYACDRKWWQAHPETVGFEGVKYGLEFVSGRNDIQRLERTGDKGLELEPTGLRTGKNSGFQAINLAVHLGARRIVLLGYDMQPDPAGRLHFYDGPRRSPKVSAPPFALFLDHFASLVEPLQALGIEIVNCSRSTALVQWPCQAIERVFEPVAA